MSDDPSAKVEAQQKDSSEKQTKVDVTPKTPTVASVLSKIKTPKTKERSTTPQLISSDSDSEDEGKASKKPPSKRSEAPKPESASLKDSEQPTSSKDKVPTDTPTNSKGSSSSKPLATSTPKPIKVQAPGPGMGVKKVHATPGGFIDRYPWLKPTQPSALSTSKSSEGVEASLKTPKPIIQPPKPRMSVFSPSGTPGSSFRDLAQPIAVTRIAPPLYGRNQPQSARAAVGGKTPVNPAKRESSGALLTNQWKKPWTEMSSSERLEQRKMDMLKIEQRRAEEVKRSLSLPRPSATTVTPTIRQPQRTNLPLDPFGRPVAGYDPFAPPTPLPVKPYKPRNMTKKIDDAVKEKSPQKAKSPLKKGAKTGEKPADSNDVNDGIENGEEETATAQSSSNALDVKKEVQKQDGSTIKVKKEHDRPEKLKPSMQQLYTQEMAAMAKEKLAFERELMMKMNKEQGKMPALPSLSQLTTLRDKPNDLQRAMDRLVDNMKKIGSTDGTSDAPQGELTKHLNQMMDTMQKEVFLGTVRTEVYNAEENMFAEAAQSYVRFSGMTKLEPDDYSRGLMAVKAEREKLAKKEEMRRGWDERRREKRRRVRVLATGLKGKMTKEKLAQLTEAQRLRRLVPAPRTPPGSPGRDSPPVSTRGSRDHTPDRLPQAVTPPGTPPPIFARKSSKLRMDVLLDDAFEIPSEEFEKVDPKEYTQKETEKKKELADLQNQYDWAMYKYNSVGKQGTPKGRPRIAPSALASLPERSKELTQWLRHQKKEQGDNRMRELLDISATNLDAPRPLGDLFDLPSSSKRPSILNRPQPSGNIIVKPQPLYSIYGRADKSSLERSNQSIDRMTPKVGDMEKSSVHASKTPLSAQPKRPRNMEERPKSPMNHAILSWAMNSVKRDDEPEEAMMEMEQVMIDDDETEEAGIERAVGALKGSITLSNLKDKEEQRSTREREAGEVDSLMMAAQNMGELKKRVEEANEIFNDMFKSLGSIDLSQANKRKKISEAVSRSSSLLRSMELWMSNRGVTTKHSSLEGETDGELAEASTSSDDTGREQVDKVREAADREQAKAVEYRLGLLKKMAEDLPERIQELVTRPVPTTDPKEARAVLDLRARIVSAEKSKESYQSLSQLDKAHTKSAAKPKPRANMNWKEYADDWKRRMQKDAEERRAREMNAEMEKRRTRQRVMLGGMVVGLKKGQIFSRSKPKVVEAKVDDGSMSTRSKTLKRRTVLIRKEISFMQRESLILSEFYNYWREKQRNEKAGKIPIEKSGVISDIEEESSERGDEEREKQRPGTSKGTANEKAKGEDEAEYMQLPFYMPPKVKAAYDVWMQRRKLTNEVTLNTGVVVDEMELEEVEVPEGMAGYYEDTRPYLLTNSVTPGDAFVLRMTEKERIQKKTARGEKLTPNERNFLENCMVRKKIAQSSSSASSTINESKEGAVNQNEPIRIPARRRGEGEGEEGGSGATKIVVTRIPGGGSRLRVVSAVDVSLKEENADALAMSMDADVLEESDAPDNEVSSERDTVHQRSTKGIVWKPASKMSMKDEVRLVMDDMLKKICGEEEAKAADALDVTPFSQKKIVISRPLATVKQLTSTPKTGALGVSSGLKEVFWKPVQKPTSILIASNTPVRTRFAPTPKKKDEVREVVDDMLKIICAPEGALRVPTVPKRSEIAPPERHTRPANLPKKLVDTAVDRSGGVMGARGREKKKETVYTLSSDDDIIEIQEEEERGESSARGVKRRKELWQSITDDDEPIVIEENKEKKKMTKTNENSMGWQDCLRLVEKQGKGESTRMDRMRMKMDKIERNDDKTSELAPKRSFTTSTGKRILLKPRRPEAEEESAPSPLSKRLVAMSAGPSTSAKTSSNGEDETPSRRVLQKREDRKRRAYSPEYPPAPKKGKVVITPVAQSTPTPVLSLKGRLLKPSEKQEKTATATATVTATAPVVIPIGPSEADKQREKDKVEMAENADRLKKQSWDIRKNDATISRQGEQIEIQKKLLGEIRKEMMKTFENAERTNQLVEQTRRAMIGECQDFAEYRKLVDAREKLMNTLYEQTMEKMKATVAAEETRLRGFENYKAKAVKREKELIKEVEHATHQLEKIQDQKLTVGPPKACPVPFTKAPLRSKQTRMNFVVESIRRVVGDGVEKDKELEKEQVKAIVLWAMRKFDIETRMSIEEDREFCTLHEISYRKRVHMKKYLTKKGLDIFPSYRAIEKMHREMGEVYRGERDDDEEEYSDDEMPVKKEKKPRKKKAAVKKMIDARDITLGDEKDDASDGDIEEIMIDEDYSMMGSVNRTDGGMSGADGRNEMRKYNTGRLTSAPVMITSDEDYVEEMSEDDDRPGPSNRYMPLPARLSHGPSSAHSHYLHGPPVQQRQQQYSNARRGRGGAKVRGGHN